MALTHSLDIQTILDTNYVCLSAQLDLGEAMHRVLQKPGRLGFVIDSSQRILGCLDAYAIAQAFQAGLSPKTPLFELGLVKVRQVSDSCDTASILKNITENYSDPVLVLDQEAKILGYISTSLLMHALLLQRQEQHTEISQLTLDLARRDEFLGIVSHDLRAPLSVIQLAVEYLQTVEHIETLSAQALSFIERIKRNSDSAQFLVNGLLESFRKGHGLRLNFDQVLLGSIVDDAVQSISLIARQKSQTIITEHLDELLVSIDVGRMRQVIENLLMNAVKYSPIQCQIKAQTRREEKDGEIFAVFRLSNPGMRISPEEGRRLFSPFVRGRNAEPLVDGVGLGLSIVQKFVDLHDGFIEVGGDNAAEVCFEVFLPHADSVHNGQKHASSAKAPTILLVDDEEEILAFMEAGLSNAGFQVILAKDGAEGYSLFKRHKPDLVFSDIRMNHLDGFELLAKIRGSHRNTPVILCSGFYAELDRDLQRSPLKPELFIQKPFRLGKLIKQIHQILAERDQTPNTNKNFDSAS
ncbi:MAG: hybrid sensor histidine kinase/response regulator [Proteobacteria bacterium]|nr:hybrid sensor histidine kinase/response regulator [Pseudomonadota bacterium]